MEIQYEDITIHKRGKCPLQGAFCVKEESIHRPHYNIYYVVNGLYHRVDGPAIIRYGGSKEWWYNGKLHNVNGPAVINGPSQAYFLDGRIKSKEDWEKEKEYWIQMDLKNGIKETVI